MKNTSHHLFNDPMIRIGLGAIFSSVLIFFFSAEMIENSENTGFGCFFINYVITVSYSIAVLMAAFKKHRWKISCGDINYTVLMLVLWFISAFALNRVMNIFDESTDWLSAIIFMSLIALLASLFTAELPLFLKHCIFFLLGPAIVLFIYYSFYLAPIYLLSMPAALGAGISLHSYIPLSLTIVVIALCRKYFGQGTALAFSFGSGVLLTLMAAGFFLKSWKDTNTAITKIIDKNILADGKLPAWAVAGQIIPVNFVTERLLKADLVYRTVTSGNIRISGSVGSNSFNEPLKHDPLVVIAGLVAGKSSLSKNDRIKLLEVMYDSRHHAQERLWSGDKLETSNVISDIKIFPEFRLAYTEKILTIRNKNKRWKPEQEAIYTFHLPEGGVVSSLSLWINGKEEKAYLSTKSKADSAYRQIVGREQRDPSVVHWQEGNTVSVRVFPCTTSEDRKFRIGISSPLHLSGRQLSYENIYFDGPPADRAQETVRFTFSRQPEGLKLPSDWEITSDHIYQVSRKYQPYWELSCKTPGLSKEKFLFNGTTYQVRDYTPLYTHFEPRSVYLDLNGAWTDAEFHTLWSKIKTKQVFVFDDELIRLNESNKEAIFNRMSKLNFSVFPVYKIADPEKALLISKSTGVSPNLKDIEESEFGRRTTYYLAKHPDIRMYNIGNQLCPYLKTLKELRVFTTHSGPMEALINLLDRRLFIQARENPDAVAPGNAGMIIEKSRDQNNGRAPDHLLRLFAYNSIMNKVASGYFSKNIIRPDILDEAAKANIVTPVSSLIVLETAEDYRRFGIEESKNSLKNASMKTSGAVPEPREWLMILLTAGIVLYLIRKPVTVKTIG